MTSFVDEELFPRFPRSVRKIRRSVLLSARCWHGVRGSDPRAPSRHRRLRQRHAGHHSSFQEARKSGSVAPSRTQQPNSRRHFEESPANSGRRRVHCAQSVDRSAAWNPVELAQQLSGLREPRRNWSERLVVAKFLGRRRAGVRSNYRRVVIAARSLPRC